jgi:hypothetical protein
MKKSGLMMLITCCVMVGVIGCNRSETVVETGTEAAGEVAVAEVATEDAEAAVRHDVVYACNCGPDCTCGSVSTEAGPCSCGSEMAATHVVKVDGHDALLCTCSGDCTCEIDAEDDTKCSCGEELKRVSLEGSGLYFCNCGGSCTCNFISAEPGKCSCGMELITS